MTKSRSELNGEPLTERQKQVIRLISQELSIKQIASEVGLSIKTVEYHRTTAMRKIGVHTTIGILRWALKNGYATIFMNSKDILDEVAFCDTREEMESVLQQNAQIIKDEADQGHVNFFLKLGKLIEEIGA